MTFRICILTMLILSCCLVGFKARTQTSQLNLNKITLPKRVTKASPQKTFTAISKRAEPPRLTDNQYQALRPQLAKLFSLKTSQIATTMKPSSNLGDVGNKVVVTIGMTPPAGGRWYTQYCNTFPGHTRVYNGYQQGGYASFSYYNAEPGYYLITITVECNYNYLNYKIADHGTSQDQLIWSRGVAYVQEDLLTIPYMKINSGILYISLNPPYDNVTRGVATVFSCEFLRVF